MGGKTYLPFLRFSGSEGGVNFSSSGFSGFCLPVFLSGTFAGFFSGAVLSPAAISGTRELPVPLMGFGRASTATGGAATTGGISGSMRTAGTLVLPLREVPLSSGSSGGFLFFFSSSSCSFLALISSLFWAFFSNCSPVNSPTLFTGFFMYDASKGRVVPVTSSMKTTNSTTVSMPAPVLPRSLQMAPPNTAPTTPPPVPFPQASLT